MRIGMLSLVLHHKVMSPHYLLNGTYTDLLDIVKPLDCTYLTLVIYRHQSGNGYRKINHTLLYLVIRLRRLVWVSR